MTRFSRVLILIAFALFATACPNTKFVSTHRTPDAQGESWQGKKVACFVITLNDSIRRGAEGSLARELTKRGAIGVVGQTLVPNEVIRDEEKVRKLLQDANISGAVVMRVIGDDVQVSQSPGSVWYTGSYYPTFYGYWGYNWNAVYTPGYMATDKVVSVETLLYSVTQDELLWGGVTKTTNPDTVPKFIGELVEAVSKEVKKSGLTAK